MRTCKSLFWVVAFLLAVPALTQAADLVQSLAYAAPDLSVKSGYTVVSMPGTRSIGDTGAPLLPSVGVWFLLPPGERAENVKLRNEVWKTLPGSHIIAPTNAPQKLSDTQYTPTPPDPAIYKSSGNYPAEAVSDLQTMLKRGVSVASCLVWPVRWDPDGGVIQYLTSAELVLSTQPGEQELSSFNRFYRGDRLTQDWISRHVVNPGNARLYPMRDNRDAIALYIVCASNLVNDMIDYVHWRQGRGVLTYIEDVAVLIDSQNGADDQDKIRNGIISAYENFNADYVLLVGDDETIPHRGLYGIVNDNPDQDIPADLYYAGLDGNWNGDGDDYWGESRESDLLSEVFVGRLPVDTPGELANILNKTMMYTDEPVIEDIETALMVGEDLGWQVWGGDYMDEVYEGSNAWNYRTVGFPEHFQRTNLYERERRWQAVANLAPLISNGQHFIHHLGHANTWYALKFDINQVSNQNIRNNGVNNGFNIVWSQGCYAGAFDNRSTEPGQYGGDCIAERFTVEISNGFVAYVANSRYGWGSGGDTNGASQHYHREFVDAMFNEDLTVIGHTNQDSKEDTAPWIDRGAMRWCYYEINLFGDPMIDMWTRTPVELEAQFAPVILIGEETYPVNIPGVSNATVCISRNNEIISAGQTDGDGFILLDIPEPILPPGPVDLTIIAHDHFPLRTRIQSASPDAGFPWVDNVIVRDVGDHPDGRADAGERIILSPVVSNLGHGALTGLRVTAASEDIFVSFDNNSVGYPDIAGDRQSLPSEPLALSIHPNCEDLHETVIQLVFTDTEGTEWNQEISFFVHAPVFSESIITILDRENGNGNGRLDPGEAVDLVFSLSNGGTGSARNLSLNLTSGSPTIEVLEGESSINLIEPFHIGAFTPNFSIRVNADCPDPYRAFLYLTMNNGVNTIRSFVINLKIGGVFCNFDDAEAELWEHEIIDQDYVDQWHYCDNDNHTYNGSGCLKVGDQGADSQYQPLLNCALYMPPFEVTGPLQLMFWHKIDAEISVAHPGYAYDGGFVEISADGGDWELLTPNGGGGYPYLFRRGGSPSPMQQDHPCFSGVTEWEQVVFNLNDYRDTEAQIRFRFGSDGSTNGRGWWIDDVELMLPMDMASPVNLTGAVSLYGVNLSWETPSPSRDEGQEDNLLQGYYVYRNTGVWRRLDSLIYVNRFFDNLVSLPSGRLTYMVSAKYSQGESIPSNFLEIRWVNGVDETSRALPEDWALTSVYPNPFNSVTRVDYAVPSAGAFKLAIYDQLGREVMSLFEGTQQPGRYTAAFEADGLPSGIYFARLETPSGSRSAKMVLIR